MASRGHGRRGPSPNEEPQIWLPSLEPQHPRVETTPELPPPVAQGSQPAESCADIPVPSPASPSDSTLPTQVSRTSEDGSVADPAQLPRGDLSIGPCATSARETNRPPRECPAPTPLEEDKTCRPPTLLQYDIQGAGSVTRTQVDVPISQLLEIYELLRPFVEDPKGPRSTQRAQSPRRTRGAGASN